MGIYGYMRVSTREQNLDRQTAELKKYVAEDKIYSDKASGKDFDRPAYQALKKAVSDGSIIYIKSLDRLGRNKTQIKEELQYFKSKNIRIKILDIPTSLMEIQQGQEWLIDMINNLLLEVLSTMAEQERLNIRKRQEEGIKALKDRNEGKGIGRPQAEYPKDFEKVYRQWQNKEITANRAMELLDLKRTTFYKLVKQYEG